MEKNTQIFIGLGIAGGLYYLYTQNKKKKASDLELQQKSALKNKVSTSILSGSLLRVNADNKGDSNKGMLDSLKKTIDADLLSIEELQKISDGIDSFTNSYVGTKSKTDIANAMNEVLKKYQIN